jgi:hypothetical protein
MSLPSFSGLPAEEQHRYYRNLCIDLKKTIKSTKDIEILQEKMQSFVNASHEVEWPHHTTSVYHKDEAEKAVQKVVSEFRRYVQDLKQNSEQAQPEDLITSITLVESLLERLKVR